VKISVYIPKELEEPLRVEAAEAGESPSIFLQGLVRERLGRGSRTFSDDFAALAGSWEDTRTAAEIIRDLEENRRDAARQMLG
jgi:hypothetical protein